MGKVYDQIGTVKANIHNVQTALSTGDHTTAIRNWKLAKSAYDVYLTAKKNMSGKTKLSRSRQTKLNDMANFESAYKEFKQNWGTQLDELDKMIKEAEEKKLQEEFKIARDEMMVKVNKVGKQASEIDKEFDKYIGKTTENFRQAIDEEFETHKSKLIVAGNAEKLKKRFNVYLQRASVPNSLGSITKSSEKLNKCAEKLKKLSLDPRDKSPEATSLKNRRNLVSKAITSIMRKGQKAIGAINSWTTYVQKKEKLVDQEEERLLQQQGSEGR